MRIHKKITDLFKNVLLLLVTVGITFLLAEIALRVFLPDRGGELITISFSENFVEKDDVMGYTGVPFAKGVCYNCETKVDYKLNAEGFRDKDRAITTDKYRIMVIGDSFVWGVGAEQNGLFTALLEKMDPDLDVMNVSVPGWATNQEYFYLENYGLQYKPDMVIVMFFIENDLIGNGVFEKDGYKNYGLPETKEKTYNKFSIKYVQDHSRIYRLWKRKRRDLKVIWGMDPILSEYRDDSVEWQATKKWISKFKELADRNNIRLIFVLTPGRNQFFLKKDRDIPQKMLGGYLRSIGVPYIDLFPVFAEIKASGKKDWGYFKYDGHWDGYGHEVVADTLYPVIKNYPLRKRPGLTNKTEE